jgi:hypothetical protein
MIVDIENETLKQELREGLLEAVSFGSFCRELAGAGLEAELHDLEAAAQALHSAALVHLGA